MKNKIILGLLLSTVLLFTGCERTTLNVNMQGEVAPTSTGFIEICDEPIPLVYDSMTRIVYIHNYNGYGGSYTPYYAHNGLPYRYNPETNTFEEINNENTENE